MSVKLKPSKIKFKDPISNQYIGINSLDISGEAVIPEPPSINGTYTLRCVVSNGTVTYSWVSTS